MFHQWANRNARFVFAIIALVCTFLVGRLYIADEAIAATGPMTLGEFTTVEWFVQTGCVSQDPAKPNYITFSSIYLGTSDAVLSLVHAVDGKWETPNPDDLRISVQGVMQGGYVTLSGNARQMFDITVWHVEPNEQYFLFGSHLGSSTSTLIAKWSASERNECGTYPVP